VLAGANVVTEEVEDSPSTSTNTRAGSRAPAYPAPTIPPVPYGGVLKPPKAEAERLPRTLSGSKEAGEKWSSPGASDEEDAELAGVVLVSSLRFFTPCRLGQPFGRRENAGQRVLGKGRHRHVTKSF